MLCMLFFMHLFGFDKSHVMCSPSQMLHRSHWLQFIMQCHLKSNENLKPRIKRLCKQIPLIRKKFEMLLKKSGDIYCIPVENTGAVLRYSWLADRWIKIHC